MIRKDNCKNLIKYDGKNITISGLKWINEIIDFNLTEIQIKNELIQAACDIAQIYDFFRYSNCEKISLFPKDSPQREKFILEAHKSEQRLLEFLLLLRLASTKPSKEVEKSIANWIAFLYVKKMDMESPMTTEKTKSGEVTRERLPIDLYNKLKRDISYAKTNNPVFKEALLNSHFDDSIVFQ